MAVLMSMLSGKMQVCRLFHEILHAICSTGFARSDLQIRQSSWHRNPSPATAGKAIQANCYIVTKKIFTTHSRVICAYYT